ncbi:MAG: diacylglycerol/polyprenol kinase family protein [Gammaproteobacteria bacterium]
MIGNIQGILLITALLAGVIGVAECWTRFRNPETEYSRKFVHFFVGIVCLALPWLVRSPWTVALIALGFAVVLGFGEKKGYLQCLGRVRRASHGSEYYPVAVAVLFVMSEGRPWLYVASLLVLSVSDACAALVGGRYGRILFQVGEKDFKSFEGSVFFWLITFQVLQITLLLMTDLPRLTCILAALIVSVLLTGVEAVSAEGSDNFFVPVLTGYILLKVTMKSSDDIIFQTFSLVVLFLVLTWMIAAFKLFSVREAILFLLNAYAYWSLGSFDWALPVLITYILYTLIRYIAPNRTGHEVHTDSMLRVFAVPFSVLIIAEVFDFYGMLYGPFLLASVLALVFSGWIYLLRNHYLKAANRTYLALFSGMLVLPIVVVPAALRIGSLPWLALAWMSLIAGLCSMGYDRMVGEKFSSELRSDWANPMWMLQLSAVVSLTVLQKACIVPIWMLNQ